MPALSEYVQDERYRLECEAKGVLDVYLKLRAEGNNPGFAAMLALQSPPGAKSDREFLIDRAHGKQFDKMGRVGREYILSQAKKAGINISGKVYQSSLGKPNDPLAWVSDRHDVLKAAQIKNLTVSGAVNHQGIPQPPKRKLIADDLLKAEVAKELAADPVLAEKVRKTPKAVKEVEQKVIDRVVPKRHQKRRAGNG